MRLKEILDRIFPAGEIVLERVPLELRQQLWDATPEKFYETVAKVNSLLISSGEKPLTAEEREDAEQVNYLTRRRQG